MALRPLRGRIVRDQKLFSAIINRGLASTVDYVVVGAGSAGCVLANRLTQDGQANQVAVLEAGKSDVSDWWDSWKIHMPSALTYNLNSNKYNWDFYTRSQRELHGRQVHQPRGKVVGGSSSINAMVYIRGHPLDQERWADEGAGDSWRYRHCLPYFKRAQTHEDGPDLYRGGEGPLHVSNGNQRSNELFDTFITAGQQAGYERTEDLNGFRQEGFGPMDMTITPDGRRCSAATAYLHPAMRRLRSRTESSIELFTQSTARRLIFDGDERGTARTGAPPRVVGVEFSDKRGRSHRVMARKEVLLCAGAIHSPHLLMMSGIGDAEQLREAQIECRLHNPHVGANLQDHLDLYIQFKCVKPVSLFPLGTWKKPHREIAAAMEWMLRGSGPVASNHFESGAFVRSRTGVQHPDIQMHFMPLCVVGQADVLEQHGFQIHCSTMRPLSRGRIALNPDDPGGAPVIDPEYLTHPQDIVDFRNGVRVTEEIIAQTAFDPYRGQRISPMADVNLDRDEEVDEFVRSCCHSAYHPSSTCAMGTVVDSSARLLGVDGVRVIDASIMPSCASGNLNAPTIMMAEKLADTILDIPPLEACDVVGGGGGDDELFFVHPNWENAQR